MIIPSGGRWSRLQLRQVVPRSLYSCLLAQTWQAKGEWVLLWRLSSWIIPVSSSSGNWHSVPSEPHYQLILFVLFFPCLPTDSLPCTLPLSITHRPCIHKMCVCVTSCPLASSKLCVLIYYRHSSTQVFFQFPKTHHAPSYLRTFARPDPSAWNYLATICICLTGIHLSDCSWNLTSLQRPFWPLI